MATLALVVPVLPVRDLARAMDFYRTLGFTAHAWQNGDTYAFLHRDSSELHLRAVPKLDPALNPTSTYFFLNTGTAESLVNQFEAAGIEIAQPLTPRPWGQREFVLRDLDGNQLIFGESIPGQD